VFSLVIEKYGFNNCGTMSAVAMANNKYKCQISASFLKRGLP